jgi:uncharacterized protein (TIGR03643 family)
LRDLFEPTRAPRPQKRPSPVVDTNGLDEATISEVIEMALSDHVSFAQIRAQRGLSPDQVKEIMRSNLKPGSYRAWRRRVQTFGARRAHYK